MSNVNLYTVTVSPFSGAEALLISENFYEKFLSVSCIDNGEFWSIEILCDIPPDHNQLLDLFENKKTNIDVSEVPDVDWLERCFANFKPITVGPFFICGSHMRDEKFPSSKINIEIDAATAFGTGEHATTELCLHECYRLFDPKKHKRCMDLGCGSGILAIALAKLGCNEVFAYDNDKEAVRVCNQNILINNTHRFINVLQNNFTEFSKVKYDFIVANILAEPLVLLAEEIVHSLNEQSILVLSGFTENRKIIDKYTTLGIDFLYTTKKNGWLASIFRKD